MNNIVLSADTTPTHQYRTGKRGVCVQIGLHQTAEFLYLTQPDWKAVMSRQVKLKQIPKSITDPIQSWQYYGVDSDVGSIYKMIQKYGNPSGAHWVHASVGTPTDRLIGLQSYLVSGRFIGFACSLQRLFQLLNLTQVDVLNIDVEGAELAIFQHYDWVITPSFISVEVHGDHNNPSVANPALLSQHIDVVHNILSNRGYRLLNKEMTNPNITGLCTCELQYQL